jgi:hypothetical protein
LIWYFGSIDDDKGVKEKLELLPELCAEQMLNGTAIELMDGDTSFIYTRWI